ncbi:hypothetical protein M0811_10520 [Anaeramoeba ignava]|uniref:Uncharacterized protein n=1 Tax=Anaeramoeba ignava TaxID=1746090 RepID=A0A9Q0R9C2_ANAIG|nr:hypothetical protein M0811_10520 [Anaeramoeba ignava]
MFLREKDEILCRINCMKRKDFQFVIRLLFRKFSREISVKVDLSLERFFEVLRFLMKSISEEIEDERGFEKDEMKMKQSQTDYLYFSVFN